jgi:hypothetical protein
VKTILPNLREIYYITDSPLSQYRNKFIVKLVAKHAVLFHGIQASWNYLETGHRKGPCDGVGGSIKRSAELAVKSGKIITSAENFFDWAINANTAMQFLLVTPQEIKEAERKIQMADYVKGISNVHSQDFTKGKSGCEKHHASNSVGGRT